MVAFIGNLDNPYSIRYLFLDEPTLKLRIIIILQNQPTRNNFRDYPYKKKLNCFRITGTFERQPKQVTFVCKQSFTKTITLKAF